MSRYLKRTLALLLAAVLLLSMLPAALAAESDLVAAESEAHQFGVYAGYRYTVHVDAPGGANDGYFTDREPVVKFDPMDYGPAVAETNKAVLTFHNVGEKALELTFGSCTWATVVWDESNGNIPAGGSGKLTVTPKANIPVDHEMAGLLLMEQNSRVGWSAILDIEIKPIAVSVTAGAVTKSYGQTLSAAEIKSLTVSGGVDSLVALEALGYTLESEGFAANAAVGTEYPITVVAGKNVNRNYNVDTTATIGNVTVNKAIPELVWVNASSVLSGADLSASKLEGAYRNLYTGEEIPGTFAWKDSGTVETVEDGQSKLVEKPYTFTPRDTGNYEIVNDATVSLTVVGKAVTTIALADTDQLNVTYDGKAHPVNFKTDHGEVVVKYKSADAQTWDDAVPKAAGTYQVQATVEPGDDYAGDSYTAVLTISPVTVDLRLAEPGAITGRQYNGGTKATLNTTESPNQLSNQGRIQFSGVVSGDSLTIDYSKITAVYDDPNVGRDKTVTVTVPAEAITCSDNYVFAGQTFVTKGDIIVLPIGLTMKTNITKEYGQSTQIMDADFEASGLAEGDQKDAVHVELYSAGVEAKAAVGSYDVNVKNSWGNYSVSAVSGSFTVVAATPVAAGAVSAGNGGKGRELSTVALSGTFQNPYTGEIVPGTLAWTTPATLLPNTAGQKQSYAWTFTPNDTKNYGSTEGVAEVTTMEKDPVDVQFVPPANLVYNGQAKVAGGSSKDANAKLTIQYRISGTEEWFDDAPTDAGTYEVRVSANVPDTDEYASNSIIGTMVIQPATPGGTAGVAETPEEGTLLGDVAMTGAFKGVDGAALMGTLTWNSVGGELPGAVPVQYGTAYGWTFTPDSSNYAAVTGTITFSASKPPAVDNPSAGGGNTSDSTEPDPAEPDSTEPSDNVPKFVDVPENAWYADAVGFAAELGLMKGVGNDKFDPNGTTTRGQLMTILARMMGAETEGGSTWYEKGMEWAKANGISDGTRPEDVITREQLATMLWRYAGEPAVSSEKLASFPDFGKVSSYAKVALAWAVENGIILGSDGKLLPEGNATRAQVATMLQRFCQNILGE